MLYNHVTSRRILGWVACLGLLIAGTSARGGEILTADTFKQIGAQGFGDRGNSYAWAMAYFKGKIYIGTNQNFVCLVRTIRGVTDETANPEVPVDCDPRLLNNDFRARIYSYDPATREVELVFISPTMKVLTSDGGDADVAMDLGYRTMKVFREADGTEALYVGTFVSAEIGGSPPRILRSVDGRHFEPLPGPISNDSNYVSYRGLTIFKDKLYCIAIGKVDKPSNLLEFTDPAAGEFRVVNAPFFGDPVNISVFDLASFKGYLYVGTATADAGFQLLKTQATGTPPYTFTTVLSRGAYRGASNQNIVSMQPFKDYLFVGTGINFVALDFFPGLDAAAAELLRVKADDSWDIVCGQERDTPVGHKDPITGMFGGCNNTRNGYIWRMTVHDGVLYMGTFDMSIFARWATDEGLTGNIDFSEHQILEWFLGWVPLSPSELADVVAAVEGGFDLWATEDADNWTQISRSGLGDEWAYGVRSFLSTPYGLFMGTANPYFGFRVYEAHPLSQDFDGDSIPDLDDNCPTTWNLDQRDGDGDNIGDACDPDRDNDCIADSEDDEIVTTIAAGPDADTDGIPDRCENDDDNDGVLDAQDNCPLVANYDQADSDDDGVGDACAGGNGNGNQNDNVSTNGNDNSGDPTDTPATCGTGAVAAVTLLSCCFCFIRRHNAASWFRT
jgi:hypothetical protein